MAIAGFRQRLAASTQLRPIVTPIDQAKREASDARQFRERELQRLIRSAANDEGQPA